MKRTPRGLLLRVAPATLLVVGFVGCSSRVSIGELPAGPGGASDGTDPAPHEGGTGPERNEGDAGDGSDGDDANDGGEVKEPGGYKPCAGKKCGQPCTLCAPNAPNCVETANLKFCQLGGECTQTTPACQPPPYKPCTAKVCGDACTICDPADPTCVESAELKQCNKVGQCLGSVVTCS